MLKFFLNDTGKAFKISFDVPVTPDAAAHPEFQKFLQAFTALDGLSFTRDEAGCIGGLSGPTEAFLQMIDQSLPPQDAATQKDIIQKIAAQHSTAGEGLEVNFHQRSFDTPERYWNFILNQGHFIDYFFNRVNWYLGPQNGYVTPFPQHVDLESASTCNMSCPMCYRSQLKDTGHMDLELFKKAVDECAAHNVFSIRLSWRGETLTHPRIKEMIAYATARIKNVSFLTNAFYINEDMIDCFIANKVAYVAVSFDGIGEIYEAVRHPAVFADSRARLALLKQKREQAGSTYPQVRLCTIWPAIKQDPEAYYRAMSPVSDYIVCNPYINFKGPMHIKPDFICQYPWERMVVGYNGDAQCCTGWNADDILLGNIKDATIEELWHSELMQKVRQLHACGQRMQLSSCAACRHGSASDPDIDIWDILERKY